MRNSRHIAVQILLFKTCFTSKMIFLQRDADSVFVVVVDLLRRVNENRGRFLSKGEQMKILVIGSGARARRSATRAVEGARRRVAEKLADTRATH